MSSVPLSMKELENITTVVARDLLEEWAINDRFSEDQLERATQDAVDDVVFVISNFMEHFNAYMIQQAEQVKLN
jgi:hypothetical protein